MTLFLFFFFSFLFQDNNGVIGLVEPLKTSKVPVKLPMMEQVVKIASGKKTFFQFFDRDLFLVFFQRLHLFQKGNDHVVMVTLEGNLYTVGTGEQGQLGRVAEIFSNRGGRQGLGKKSRARADGLISRHVDH